MNDENKKSVSYAGRSTAKPEAPAVEETEVAKSEAPVPDILTTELAQKTKSEGVEAKSETVVISQDDLAAFMRRLENLESDNKRLLEAADKARMAVIAERERGNSKALPIVRISRIGSKIVVAWRMTKNESYMEGKRVIELQEIEVFFEDGTSERMPLLTFYRQQDRTMLAEILSRSVPSDSNDEMLHVRIKDSGKELDISVKFVN